MRTRSFSFFLLVLLLLCRVSSSQVMSIASSATTGLDVRLSTGSYNYTFFPGYPSLWGQLGPDGYVEYTISAAAGNYAMQVYYSNGTESSGSLSILINGNAETSISIPSTGSWDQFQLSGTGTINLSGGQSTLRLATGDTPQPYNLAGITLTPLSLLAVPTTMSNASPPNASSNPLLGTAFFVNPYSLAAINSYLGCQNGQCISKIASQPQGVWFGNWNTDPRGDAATVMAAAAATGTAPILVAYNIPNRDCGGYSSGGAPSNDAYQSWIGQFALGIGAGKAVVILEPDALTQYNTAGCLNDTQKNDRLSLMQYAVSQFNQHAPNAAVYLDAGPPNALPATLMGQTLLYGGIANATGFAVNVSNYESTADSIAYGDQVSAVAAGKHYVIDTSRNGRGATSDHQYCNPPNRGLGQPSQAISGSLVDAYLWVQNPGTSDGTCNGGPPAGSFSAPLAWTLLQNSAF